MLWTMLVMMACSTQVTNPSAVDDDYAKLARRLPEFAGMTLAAIDEMANRIRLGVATEKARSRLGKQLMEIGLPADMVFVEVLPPYQRLSR